MGRERRAVLVAAILASSLGFIDGSVVSVAIPAIREDLGAGFAEVQWIANAYTLFLSALILIGGAAGDRFGQRETFAAGIALFSATSIGCALAPSAAQLVVWRAAQGIGAAFMVPGSLALIAASFPKDERGRAIGWWSMASGIAAALGPLAGGFWLEAAGPSAWRWIFWINPPVGVLTIALLLRFVPRSPARTGPVDVGGAVLATLALFLLAYALTEASGSPVRPAVIALAGIGGIAVAALFLWWERRTPAPMLPLELFASRAFVGANILTFTLYFALAGSLFFLPMTLIEALGTSEGAAGFVFLPFTVMMALVARASGGLADRRGPRLPITAGSLVVAAAFLLAAAAVVLRAYGAGVLPAMALLGLGMGLVIAPLSTAVMGAVADENAGAASGVNNGVARMAGLFAVAALSIVASLAYRAGLDPSRVPGDFGQPATGLDPGAAAMRADAMVSGFLALSVVTALLAAASAAVAWLSLPDHPPAQASPER